MIVAKNLTVSHITIISLYCSVIVFMNSLRKHKSWQSYTPFDIVITVDNVIYRDSTFFH